MHRDSSPSRFLPHSCFDLLLCFPLSEWIISLVEPYQVMFDSLGALLRPGAFCPAPQQQYLPKTPTKGRPAPHKSQAHIGCLLINLPQVFPRSTSPRASRGFSWKFYYFFSLKQLPGHAQGFWIFSSLPANVLLSIFSLQKSPGSPDTFYKCLMRQKFPPKISCWHLYLCVWLPTNQAD